MTTTKSAAEEERLEDGWHPRTPVTDTLMRQIVLDLAEEMTSNAAGLGGRIERNDHFTAADIGRPAAHYNACVLTRPLDQQAVAAVMSDLDAFFDRGGSSTGTVVIFSPWPEPDLRRYGWRLLGYPPAHVRPSGIETPSDPPGVEIMPVTTLAELREWERTAIIAYPFAECQASPPGSVIAESLLSDPRRRFWTARLDGTAAGVASALVDNGLNYVPLVATMPEARGRGIGTALTWRATLAEPSLPSALLSSDEGRPIYDRMGYLPLIRMTLWYRYRLGF